MRNKKHAAALVEKSPVREMYALTLILPQLCLQQRNGTQEPEAAWP